MDISSYKGQMNEAKGGKPGLDTSMVPKIRNSYSPDYIDISELENILILCQTPQKNENWLKIRKMLADGLSALLDEVHINSILSSFVNSFDLSDTSYLPNAIHCIYSVLFSASKPIDSSILLSLAASITSCLQIHLSEVSAKQILKISSVLIPKLTDPQSQTSIPLLDAILSYDNQRTYMSSSTSDIYLFCLTEFCELSAEFGTERNAQILSIFLSDLSHDEWNIVLEALKGINTLLRKFPELSGEVAQSPAVISLFSRHDHHHLIIYEALSLAVILSEFASSLPVSDLLSDLPGLISHESDSFIAKVLEKLNELAAASPELLIDVVNCSVIRCIDPSSLSFESKQFFVRLILDVLRSQLPTDRIELTPQALDCISELSQADGKESSDEAMVCLRSLRERGVIPEDDN